MDVESLFSLTWHPYAIDQDKNYSEEPPTRVEFRLAKISIGTHLTVTENGFDQIPASRRAEAFLMNEGGWVEQMKNNRDYLA